MPALSTFPRGLSGICVLFWCLPVVNLRYQEQESGIDVSRNSTPNDLPEHSASLRKLFRHIRERVPLHEDIVAEIAQQRGGLNGLETTGHDIQRYVERWSTMTDQELKYVAEKWVAEYGDEAPSQIRQWAKDQDLETDAPVFFERVASLAERMLADRDRKQPSQRPN